MLDATTRGVVANAPAEPCFWQGPDGQAPGKSAGRNLPFFGENGFLLSAALARKRGHFPAPDMRGGDFQLPWWGAPPTAPTRSCASGGYQETAMATS